MQTLDVDSRTNTNTIKQYIGVLAGGGHLSMSESHAAFALLMTGGASPAQVAALLIAITLRQPTVDEIAGAAGAMRAEASKVTTSRDMVMDVCGTGGDGLQSFNISTATAFVVAGAGIAVAKHGNYAISSCCGSADVLTALGVQVDAAPDVATKALDNIGFAFLLAPRYHPAMRHVAAVRREIGVPTIFNLLGPLTNPAAATHQLVGVANAQALPRVAQALERLGTVRAAVVCGHDGMDEVTLSGPTSVLEWTGDTFKRYSINPEDVGVRLRPASAVRGGDAAYNAAIIRSVLEGALGPHRDVVLLNAGLALKVAQAAESCSDGMAAARRSIDSGAALAKLEAAIAAAKPA